MNNKKIKELSLDSFHIYGSFADMINPGSVKFGEKPIEFYRDMVLVDLGTSRSAAFSTLRVCKRPPIVDVSEFHDSCEEGILSLDSDILIPVAPAAAGDKVAVESIEIFRAPKGTMISLRPGVWHHAPFAYGNDEANVLIVLPERLYAIDCTVCRIPRDEQIEIEGA